MMGISIWQLLIILLIVVVLFGTKKLRNIGGDLGAAIKNFRSSMREGEVQDDNDNDGKKDKIEETANTSSRVAEQGAGRVIEGKVAAEQQNTSKTS